MTTQTLKTADAACKKIIKSFNDWVDEEAFSVSEGDGCWFVVDWDGECCSDDFEDKDYAEEQAEKFRDEAYAHASDEKYESSTGDYVSVADASCTATWFWSESLECRLVEEIHAALEDDDWDDTDVLEMISDGLQKLGLKPSSVTLK